MMLSISLLLTTLCVLLVRADPSSEVFGIPIDQWQCGTDANRQQLVVKAIHDNCPVAAGDFNHCCAIHADCYSSLRGLEKCNDNLCKCVDKAARQSSKQCPGVATDVCNSVRVAGQQFYPTYPQSSLPHQPLHAQLRKTPALPKVMRLYERLYEACPYQNRTLASCATNYDVCRGFKNAPCVRNLMMCLFDSKVDREKDKRCDGAMDVLSNELLALEEKEKATPQPIIRERTVVKEKKRHRYIHKVSLRSAVADSQMFVFLIAVGMSLLLCVAASFSYRIEGKMVEVEVPDESVRR